jgi:hypothetical protein
MLSNHNQPYVSTDVVHEVGTLSSPHWHARERWVWVHLWGIGIGMHM